MVAEVVSEPSGTRLRDALLASLGVVAAALVLVPTVVALRLTDPPATPAPVVRLPARAVSGGPSPSPVTASGTPSVAAAQAEMDADVARFASSIDVQERTQLLQRIHELAATPGVTVPNR